MVKLTIDKDIRMKLGDLKERLQLCDETGKVLGYFQPVVDPSHYEAVNSPTSQEELNRRSREGGGRALADILADLENQA